MGEVFSPRPVIRRNGGKSYDWHYIPTTDINTGNLVQIGKKVGIVDTPSRGTGDRILKDDLTSISLEGRYLFPKAAGKVYVQGDVVKVADITWEAGDTGTIIVGLACKPAGAEAADVEVELNDPLSHIPESE